MFISSLVTPGLVEEGRTWILTETGIPQSRFLSLMGKDVPRERIDLKVSGKI